MREHNIVLVLALSHVCVTNRSGLVYLNPALHPLPLPLTMHSLSPSLPGNRVKGWLAGCLVTEKSCNTDKNRRNQTTQSWSKNQNEGQRGEKKPFSGRDCALRMLMRQGPFFLFSSSKWTNKQHCGCVGDLYSACPQSDWAQAALKIQYLHYFTYTIEKKGVVFQILQKLIVIHL